MNYKCLVLLVIFFSCAKQVSTQAIQKPAGPWEVGVVEVNDNMMSVVIKNTLDKPLNVHAPLQQRVSVKGDDGWEWVSVLYCDCGTSCPPPPEMLLVDTNGTFTVSLDLNIENCSSEGLSLSTIKTKAPAGSYLFEVFYSISGSRERSSLEIPFTID